MTGTPTRPPTTLGQGAFHAGADDHYASFGQSFAIGEKAVDSGDADVVEVFDLVAHEFGGHDRFFGYGDVAGSRGNHGDGSFAVGVGVALRARSLAPVRDILRRVLSS